MPKWLNRFFRFINSPINLPVPLTFLRMDSPYVEYSIETIYKQDVYAVEERLDFTVPDLEFQIMTRDLQLTKASAGTRYYSDRYTPKSVIFANGLTFPAADAMESMKISSSEAGSETVAGFYLDYGLNHPHFHFVKGNVPNVRVAMNENFRRKDDRLRADLDFAVYPSGTVPFILPFIPAGRFPFW